MGAAVAHRGARCGTELPDARRRRSGRQAGKRHDVKGALLGDTLGIWCVLRVVLVIGSEYFSYMLAGKWRGWTGIPQWTWRSVRRQLCDVAGIREVGCRLAKQKKMYKRVALASLFCCCGGSCFVVLFFFVVLLITQYH